MLSVLAEIIRDRGELRPQLRAGHTDRANDDNRDQRGDEPYSIDGRAGVGDEA